MRYMKWVPLIDRHPDTELREYRARYGETADIELIVLIKGEEIPTVLAYDGIGFFIPGDEDREYYSITHWMHMPPRPDECLIDIDLGDKIEADYEMLEVILT